MVSASQRFASLQPQLSLFSLLLFLGTAPGPEEFRSSFTQGFLRCPTIQLLGGRVPIGDSLSQVKCNGCFKSHL
jgi:hypothetical protein